LGIDDTTLITIEDIEGHLDVLDFFDWDGEGSEVLGSPLFLLGNLWLGLLGLGFWWHLEIYLSN
jgi:hypothetical protein